MGRLPAVERLSHALQTLRPVSDIVEQRVETERAPGWCERRGWVDFLLSLPDETVHRCEAEGLAVVLPRVPNVPRDLAELARSVGVVTLLPVLSSDRPALPSGALERVRARKREQLGLLLGALGPMAATAARVVDVGAGRGAFTRLAARQLRRPTLGIERSRERVATAAAHAETEAEAYSEAAPEFRASDVCRDGLELSPEDLVVGLHACGELGDELVRAVAGVGCDAALISCCLQKISEPRREPLSGAAAGMWFSRGVLGLTNQTAQSVGVEGSLEQMLSGREVRFALHALLRARGVELEPGAAMNGINRRRTRDGLRGVADRALALRRLQPASDTEIAHYERLAHVTFARVRRLSLPRALLARLVEVSITLDRAAYLEEHGLSTQVGTLFDPAVSPRNIALFASVDAARLPSAC